MGVMVGDGGDGGRWVGGPRWVEDGWEVNK